VASVVAAKPKLGATLRFWQEDVSPVDDDALRSSVQILGGAYLYFV
jgi:hypothetical protein